MMHLTNKAFKDNILTDILELSSTDLNIVTKDGTYSTQKLLLWAAFPALQQCLLECVESLEEVTIILPHESVDNVQEGIVKMLLEGDISYLESCFGMKASVDILNPKKNSNKQKITRKLVVDKKIPVNDYCKTHHDHYFPGKDPLELNQDASVKEETFYQQEQEEEFIPPPKKRLKNHKVAICGECGKEFRDRSNLNRHLQTGHKTKKCDRCDDTFEGHDVLSIHRKNCRLRCELCDWVTKCVTGEQINGHKRRHAKEGEKCTFVSQQIEEDELEALKNKYNDKWKNKERQYTERITYVYKYRKDDTNEDPDSL